MINGLLSGTGHWRGGLLALLLASWGGPLMASETLTVGVAAFDNPQRVAQRWQPTLDYLNQGQAQYRFELLALPPKVLEQRLAEGAVDLLIQNSVKTVQYKEKYGASRLLTAAPLWPAPANRAIGSALVMRQGEAVTDFGQLARLKAISTSAHAFGGYTVFRRELAEQGLTPKKAFRQLTFVGFPQRKLLQQLLSGEADVAILPSCLLEQAVAEREVPEGSLTVALDRRPADFPCAVSSRLYPYFAVSKLGHVSPEVATFVARRLLTMAGDAPAAQRGRYSQWTVPVDDREVYALLKAIKLWPFNTDWHHLARQALPWAGLAALILLLGYLHHLRVKALVARRTSQLTQEMTQHSATQAHLQEQRSAFYKAQRVLLTGEMASGLSHELNQPLASIRYLAQGCGYRLDGEPLDREALAEGLKRIEAQTEKAQGIIQRVKRFCARPSKLSSLALSELVTETLALMEPDLRRNRSRVRFDNRLADNLAIQGDPVLLQQVLVNLVRNALDAMAEVAEPQREVVIALTREAERVQLSVRDHGPGLAPAALDRLFLPFESSKTEGLGLGMMICRRIIEEHHGTIWAESAEPGLRVTFSIPIEENP
ncbi:PhnD/SsuA/transferrin family substrate-binding protein [Ferrimonas balearica]|uniref:sensor histidine kinase n=1 Tax=Ferrimonas balearica TaxID=44012 RepID=UPI001C996B0F|nr:ATP-binding protein [Ferrimonas balearica]MBY5992676.1 PhnD/SsuA/transferrin family substrate-binding protein [Ferrimonas balearica]